MKIYKLLPHTADTRLYVEASTLPELFETALKGMSDIIKKTQKSYYALYSDRSKVYNVLKEVKIESPDITSLLIDFLSEILTYSQEEKAVFRKADIKKLTDTILEAEIFGEKVDEFDEDIKAVTYHEAEVRKNKRGNWEVTIIFDI